ncbi:Pyruvate formate lyase domain [Moorella glycerini]|uniref:Benzylsuccinate synthase alpha subunit n=1 Tax=Neomoorella stamsii TaxID=1266720 RepID=A0A9X7P7G4_9FIRM|nr:MULTISPECIES: pyruvate formate lyase family protein [Moorella]PRR77456.1 Benzylsuccinate synthase alpha subunit [Moorella stamsii]CEP68205.1 Pyruvate formate lyase domain [Moorella glycerini]
MAAELKPFQMELKPERTPRIESLYQYITSFKPGICIERAFYLTESYKKNMHLPVMVRRAKAIANVLDNMTIYILPGSLLAGNQASKPRWAPLFPEFDVEWMENEIIKGNPFYPWERPADKYDFDQGKTGELKAILDWWKGQTHTDRLRGRLPREALITHFDIKAVDIGAYFQGGDGHYSPDHKWLFEHGLQYIIDQCEDYLSKLDWSAPDSILKKDFYESAIISCKAVIRFAHRYAELAERLASEEKDETRRQELLRMAEICRRVPQYPARTFHEALQFMYFIHLCIQIEDNGAGISIGRYDQIMWDIYQKDLHEGRLTREQALELTENFYLQIYTLNKIRSWGDTDYFRGVPMFQNLTIGGQDPKTKSDSTNELSYIALEATANTRVPQPSLTVRFHRKTPLEFKIKVAEVIRLGMGLPSVFNDEVYIPALINRGYEIDDAYNYCIIGCVEPGVSGLLGGRTGGAWLNLTKILEMSLYNGRDPRTGITLHPNKNGKDLSTFSSFEEVKEAYLDQLVYYLTMEAILENTIDQCWEEYLEEPIAAIFGCPTTTIPRGKPLKKGGAKYDFTGQQTIGIANVANSLYAIKKLIFDDKVLTGAQLLHALETNFQDMTTNPTGPEIKAMCLNVPKYGNDIDEVDFIARDMLAYVANSLNKFKNTRYGRGPIGCIFHCSTSTVSSNTPFGKVCGATPDGRDAWTPVADGQSPMRGTDKKGPTAAIASVSKLNNILLSCGSLFNLKFVPEDLR